MTSTADGSENLARAAALAALALGQPAEPTAPALERTGNTIDVGGDVPRLLVVKASTLGHRIDGVYHRCGAVPGDVVMLTRREADRLDGLGVTVDPDTDPAEVDALEAAGLLTDEQLAQAGAADLVAYVGQNPDERARVRALEEARPEGKGKGKGPRVSVLAATEPTPVEDDEAATAAATVAAALAEGAATTGPTAEEVAAANQGDDLAGKAE